MPRRKQLTREDWIDAARRVLVTSGIDDVKIDRLARRLKLTRGSFYWHFKNRTALLDALLLEWRARNEAEIAKVRDRAVEGDDDLVEVARIWLGEDPTHPSFDMAIRFWARKAPTVAAQVREVDNQWIALLKSLFSRRGVDDLEALARARITYFHQIGYYALAIDENLDDRLRLSPYYHKVLTGTDGGDALASFGDELRARAARRPRRPVRN